MGNMSRWPIIRRSLPRLACLVILAAVAPSAAGAVDSIETLVADSDAVVVASLVQLYKDPPGEAPSYQPGRVRATLAVVEVIKGTAPAALPVIVSWPRVEAFAQWQ